jgi:thiol:disulfide interchange protein DsbD
VGHLVNYGYEGTTLLPVPITVTQDMRPSPLSPQLKIQLKAQWLVCKTECIPEEGEFELQLPVQGSTALHANDFQAAFGAAPRALPTNPSAAATGLASGARVEGQALRLELRGLPLEARGKTLALFPETAGVIDNASAMTQSWQGAVWTAQLSLSPQRDVSPGQVSVVVADGARAWRAELPVAGTWPAVSAPAAEMSPALAEALRRNAQTGPPATSTTGWLLAMLGAVLGGMLLNLMPCVFPVLAVKVVGFARHGSDPRARALSGLASFFWAGSCWPCVQAASNWGGASSFSRRQSSRHWQRFSP